MDRAFEEVREEVLGLDRESQIRIAEEILSKVSGSPENEAAWRIEIRERSAAYRRGEITSTDSEAVMARARKKIEDGRRSK